MSCVQDMIEQAHKAIEIYPIWLCPARFTKFEGSGQDYQRYVKWSSDDVIVDVGFYGFTNVPGFKRTPVHRQLEDACLEIGGIIGLYADTYLSREQFDGMYYNWSRLYESERKKDPLTAKAFPHVYEKISSLGRTNIVKD